MTDIVERLCRTLSDLPGNDDDLFNEIRAQRDEAAKEIERLRSEIALVREMAAKALKSAGELDRWHKYGEGYGTLEEFVATIAKQEKK